MLRIQLFVGLLLLLASAQSAGGGEWTRFFDAAAVTSGSPIRLQAEGTQHANVCNSGQRVRIEGLGPAERVVFYQPTWKDRVWSMPHLSRVPDANFAHTQCPTTNTTSMWLLMAFDGEASRPQREVLVFASIKGRE